MTSVCAFVLTRNRKELLIECVQALRAQTRPPERILIVDNASTDGTEQLLRDEGVLADPLVSFHRTDDNRGSAGGYAEGVRLGLAEGTEWLWLMDDDAEPRPDALERLLAAPPADDPAVAMVCSKVVQPDGSVETLHRCRLGRFVYPLPLGAYAPGTSASFECASFVGMMIRSSVAQRIGPPRAELFINYDDVEFSLRARDVGDIRLVPESVVVHKLHIGGNAVTRRSRFWNRLLGQHYTSASWEGYWKNLCGVRNFMWIKHRRRRVTPLAFAGLTATYLVKSTLYDRRPLRRLPWIVRFALAGRRGDFSGPGPEEWARITAATTAGGSSPPRSP